MSGLLDTDVALIAAREVRQRLRGKVFKVVTGLMVAAVGAAVVVPTLTRSGTPTRRVGVVGSLPSTSGAAILAAGEAVGVHVRIVAEQDAAAAHADLMSGAINLAVLDARQVVTERPVAAAETSATARVVRAVAATLGEQLAFRDAGLTPEQAAGLAKARPLPVSSLLPARTRGTTRTASVVGVILLFVLLTQYNTWTLVGVMEEKSSRVVEVLLATVRPAQLLAGKVLGIGLLVFAQAGLVVAVALALAAAVGSDLLHGAGPLVIVSTLVWLVLGYAFYSWVYAAVGSTAERQDQVQALAVPLVLPMVAAYVLALGAASTGNASTLFTVLAYLPPTAPFAMPILVGLHDVAWWQVVGSGLLSVAGTVAVARVASVVYRRAVLRTGRRVGLREVLGHRRA